MINEETGKTVIFFLILIHYMWGWGKTTPFLGHFRVWYTIYKNVIWCITILYYCMNIEQSFKGYFSKKKALGEDQACFSLNFT